MKTKTKSVGSTLILVLSCLIIACCENKHNESDPNFIVEDFEPDLVITSDNQMLIDIDKDGTDDLKIFQQPISSHYEPVFVSADSLFQISNEHYNIYNDPSLKLISEGDSINTNLTWLNQLTWMSGGEGIKVFLALKKEDKDGNLYFGWLLPMIKYSESSNFEIIIDKYVFCKLKNYEIKAGQERGE